MGPDSRSTGRGRTPQAGSPSTSSSRSDVPLIGVTHSRERNARGVLVDEPAAYVAALERLGARAEPLENDLARLDDYAARLDAVVVAGGIDVDPALYGGVRDATVDAPNPERDAFEIALVRRARELRLPLLGICRGLQIANVAFGGTLVEDLPGHRGPRDDARVHEVRLTGGRLARILGGERVATNSLHHQGVRRVADDLALAGSAPDGVVEALEARFEHPFFFAVQWHPELMPPGDEPSGRLFAAFVSAARGAFEPA